MSAPGAAPAHLARDARRIKVAAERVAAALAAGGYRSAFRGQGVEFDEVREYHDGDDVRTIDWNVTSRLGGAASPAYASAAYSKVFREERELAILLLVDRSASMLAGSAEKRDLCVWLAAILALSAQFSDDRIGACLFSDRIESWVAPARGRTRVLRLVNDLLHARPAGRGSDLALALRTVAANLQRRSVCIILSDFKTDGYRHELRAAARAHDVIAVRIAEPLDRALPAAAAVELVDPETGLRRFGVADEYRRFWDRHVQAWRTHCREAGVEVLEIGTGEDAAASLARFFAARRRRRAA